MYIIHLIFITNLPQDIFSLFETCFGKHCVPIFSLPDFGLVKYLCVGWLLLWLLVGLWCFKLVLLCVSVVYVIVFCVFSMLSALKIEDLKIVETLFIVSKSYFNKSCI